MQTVGVFVNVFNQAGELLCVRQNYGDKNWTTPGGRVESGETLYRAAVRETLEETGILVQVVGFAGAYWKVYCDDLVIALYAEITEIVREWRPNDEILDLKWVTQHSFPLPTAYNTRIRVQDAFARSEGVVRVFPTPESLS